MPPARLLVPLTLGGATPEKLSAVTAQAHALGACVTLLHVLDRVTPSLGDPSPDATGAAQNYLDEVSTQLRRDGISAKPRLRYGPIVPTINKVAREQNAAMIILGAGEPNAFQRLLPTTRAGLVGAISRDAPCPVLVVPRTPPVAALPTAA